MELSLTVIACSICFMVGFAFGLLCAARPNSRTRSVSQLNPIHITSPEDFEENLRNLMIKKQKIEAIKLVREHTGLGLKEAKDLTDAFFEGASFHELFQTSAGSSRSHKPLLTDSTDSSYPINPGSKGNVTDGGGHPSSSMSHEIVMEEVRDLLRRGKKIEALKIYKESTGLGLKEAKDHIDKMRV